MHFVFVHGWGMAPDFWNSLIFELPEVEAHPVDLGFTSAQQDLSSDISEPAIYVTHSLGTMWALKNHSAHMQGLVSINGFSCFKNFGNHRVLKTMMTRLKRHPEAQMKEFWNAGGLPPSNSLNVEQLQTGLEWLASWDATAELESLGCPVLSLAGQDDPILPEFKMKKEWKDFDLRICEGGGHALPLSDTAWCANHIKRFVREL